MFTYTRIYIEVLLCSIYSSISYFRFTFYLPKIELCFDFTIFTICEKCKKIHFFSNSGLDSSGLSIPDCDSRKFGAKQLVQGLLHVDDAVVLCSGY